MKFKPIKLVGERIVLQRLSMKDAPVIVKIMNDGEVSKYLYRVISPYKIGHAIELIEESRKKKDGYGLGISLKEDKRLIGYTGLYGIQKFYDYKSAGLKYWIRKEAISTILDYGFNKLKFNNISAKVFSPNKASGILLEKLGFKEKSRLKRQEYCRVEDI